jgi:L-amino acid N-acyltransferase YncA
MATGTMRLAREEDAPAIADIYRPSVEAAATSFEVEAPAAGEIARRLAAILPHAPWLVLEDGGVVRGYAYASRHHERAAYQWSVDVTVYVREGHRGLGVGRALYRSLFELLRLQGFYTACAGITLPNAASVGLHESLGFGLVGVYPSIGYKLGAWHDVGWWELALRPRAGTPAAPLSRAQAEATPGWAGALAAGCATSPGASPAAAG